jgi:hypothetical protein
MIAETKGGLDYSQKGLVQPDVITVETLPLDADSARLGDLVHSRTLLLHSLQEEIAKVANLQTKIAITGFASAEKEIRQQQQTLQDIQKLIHQGTVISMHKSSEKNALELHEHLLLKQLADMKGATAFTKFSMAATVGVTIGMTLIGLLPVAGTVAAAVGAAVASIVGIVIGGAEKNAASKAKSATH